MRHHRLSVSLAFVLCATLALGNGVFAGEKKLTRKDLPAPVLTAFDKAYPKAVIKGLSKEDEDGKTTYEIESVDGKTHRDIAYASDGTVLEIEEVVAEAALPGAVTAAAHKEFPKGKILKAEKLTHQGVTEYELVITVGKEKHELVFTPDGTTVKKEKKDKEDEKD
jgi:hypothetical protein